MPNRKCPICGRPQVNIDRDSDMIVCSHCKSAWESFRSFNEDSKRKKSCEK